MINRQNSLWTGLMVLILCWTGCSGNGGEAYDSEWGSDEIIQSGKADGFLDLAKSIQLGESVAGTVGGEQIVVYKIDLLVGDEILFEETVTEGDLNPHMTLFFGTSTKVSSTKWGRADTTLRKWYTLEQGGTYLLALMAYKGEGSGKYEFKVSCVGGPCNGEFPERKLEIGDVAYCVQLARRCAFNKLDRITAGTTPQALMDQCLVEASLEDGFSCQKACATQFDGASSDDYKPADLCASIVDALGFFAAQSQDCLDLLDECVSACYSSCGDGFDYNDDFYSVTEAVCWDQGFNGNCNSFARGSTLCGGKEFGPASFGECMTHCESTSGACVDDLDTICSEDCSSICDDITATCSPKCTADDTDCQKQCYCDQECGAAQDCIDLCKQNYEDKLFFCDISDQ